MSRAALLALLLAGCGGDPGSETPAQKAWLCTVPIAIQAGDYTTDLMGEWLWMPDINSEVRIMEPCT